MQRTALATSPDLINWTRHPANPVAEADRRWYETLESVPNGRVSWRDPKPILVGDTYYATVNGREKDGPLQRRGCAACLQHPSSRHCHRPTTPIERTPDHAPDSSGSLPSAGRVGEGGRGYTHLQTVPNPIRQKEESNESSRLSRNSHSAGGKNFTHTGVGQSANTPDGFNRPLPSSIRQTSSVSEF